MIKGRNMSSPNFNLSSDFSSFERFGAEILDFTSKSSSGSKISQKESSEITQKVGSFVKEFIKMPPSEKKENARQFKAVLYKLNQNDLPIKAKLLSHCANIYYHVIGRMQNFKENVSNEKLEQSSLEIRAKLNNQAKLNQSNIKKDPQYSGELDRNSAEMILKMNPGKAWLIRHSQKENCMVVSIKNAAGEISHYKMDPLTSIDKIKSLFKEGLVCDKAALSLLDAHKEGRLTEFLSSAFHVTNGDPALCRSFFSLAKDLKVNIKEELQKLSESSYFINIEKGLTDAPSIDPEVYLALGEEYARTRNFAAAVPMLMKAQASLKQPEIQSKINEYQAKIDEQSSETYKLLNEIDLSQFGMFNYDSEDSLNSMEQLALYVYTTSFYKVINALLSGDQKKLLDSIKEEFNSKPIDTNQIINMIKGIIPVIKRGLEKLPDHKATLYRGAGLTQEALEKYEIGKEIDLPRFSSSSSQLITAHRFAMSVASKEKKAVLFEIQSETGKQITKYSMMSNEAETLFLPDSRFKVIGKTTRSNGMIVFQMRQI